jgi:hypothetical protein
MIATSDSRMKGILESTKYMLTGNVDAIDEG